MDYRTGYLHDPQPGDPIWSSLSDAIARMLEKSNSDQNSVFAVWDTDDDILFIFTGGEQFTPT